MAGQQQEADVMAPGAEGIAHLDFAELHVPIKCVLFSCVCVCVCVLFVAWMPLLGRILFLLVVSPSPPSPLVDAILLTPPTGPDGLSYPV